MNWNDQLTEIEEYFKDFPFPKSIVINSYSTITDVETFYQTNLSIAKRNVNKPWFEPYFHRLLSLKCYFETGRISLPKAEINPLNNHL